MKIPCDQHIACPCTTLLTNYSSEDPDRLLFLARRFRGPGLPPMGGHDPGLDCTTFASSPISEEDADFCAVRHQTICEQTGSGISITSGIAPDPCVFCRPAPPGATDVGLGGVGNGTSFGDLHTVCTDDDGNIIPCPDPCCDVSSLPENAADIEVTETDEDGNVVLKCCCNPVPGDPDIPDEPPDNPDDPDQPPQTPLFGNDPQSCSVQCPDGSVNTFTVRAGYFIATSVGQANGMAHAYACQQAQAHKLCLGDINAQPCLDVSMDVTGDSTHGSAVTLPITFAITNGALPPGLDFNLPSPAGGTSFRINGTPTASGFYAFTVTGTAASGESHSRDYTLEVFGSTCPGDGTLCTPYVDSVVFYPPVISGGTVAMSGLPCNLSCSPSGVITGTPMEDGTFNVAVTVTAAGRSCTRNCTMKIVKNPTYPLESATFAQLTWDFLHTDEGSGSATGGSVTATTPDWKVACQAPVSNAYTQSSILRNCTGANYAAVLHVVYSLTATTCLDGVNLAKSTGQVIVGMSGGISYQNDHVGGNNPYSGSVDIPFIFSATVGVGSLYFTAKAGANGGNCSMTVTVSISPLKPPPC